MTLAAILTIIGALVCIALYEWQHKHLQRQVYVLANQRWTELDKRKKELCVGDFDKAIRLFLIILCTYKDDNLLTLWRLNNILRLPLDDVVKVASESQEIEI